MLLSACGSNDVDKESNGEKSPKAEEATGTVAPEEFDKMYGSPKNYKGHSIEFTGQVFTPPEKDEDGTYLQVYANPEKYEQNVIVGVEEPDLQVSTDDYVLIKGTVQGQMDGENLMGGTVTAPVILADTIEVIDYITAVSPTTKEIPVEQEQDQHGILVTLKKIELADNQTRVYITVANNTDSNVSLYDSNMKLIVGNKQLEPEYLPETGLPELQSDILPGVESEGVVIFPAIEEGATGLKLHAEGYSDNYEIDLKPFVFEVTVD